jgi:sugar/nucleoside kinase (ribokinase family)
MSASRPVPILVVGSIALDTVRGPRGEARGAVGGSAIYFAIAASYFTRVNLVGVVGEDFPEEGVRILTRRGVNLEGLERARGKTFAWSAAYNEDFSERTTLETTLNVFESFHPKIPAAYRRSPYVFLANIDPGLQAEVLEQIERPRLVVCDTMNLWIDFQRAELLRVLSRVDVAFFNADEARQITGDHNLIRAAAAIKRFGPRRVIVKKGEHGVLMSAGRSVFSLPAYPLDDVLDPTGAGDAFAGGFLGALARSSRSDEAGCRRSLLYGTVLASYAVQGFGVDGIKSLTPRGIAKRYAALVDHARIPESDGDAGVFSLPDSKRP